MHMNVCCRSLITHKIYFYIVGEDIVALEIELHNNIYVLVSIIFDIDVHDYNILVSYNTLIKLHGFNFD